MSKLFSYSLLFWITISLSLIAQEAESLAELKKKNEDLRKELTSYQEKEKIEEEKNHYISMICENDTIAGDGQNIFIYAEKYYPNINAHDYKDKVFNDLRQRPEGLSGDILKKYVIFLLEKHLHNTQKLNENKQKEVLKRENKKLQDQINALKEKEKRNERLRELAIGVIANKDDKSAFACATEVFGMAPEKAHIFKDRVTKELRKQGPSTELKDFFIELSKEAQIKYVLFLFEKYKN